MKQQGKFFALLSRMKYIRRWGLMRNTRQESLSEHTLETAYIAHALVLIHNKRCGGAVDPAQVVFRALYHDAAEILTGDLPTPVKYKNPQIRTAYGAVETAAVCQMLSFLPEDLQADYQPLLMPDEESVEGKLVKAADKLSALIKCLEEQQAGNHEFKHALNAQLSALRRMELPAANIFIDEFLEAYQMNLDELSE